MGASTENVKFSELTPSTEVSTQHRGRVYVKYCPRCGMQPGMKGYLTSTIPIPMSYELHMGNFEQFSFKAEMEPDHWSPIRTRLVILR